MKTRICTSFLKKEAETDIGVFHTLEGDKLTFIEGRSKRLKRLVIPIVDLFELTLSKESDKFNSLLETYLIDKKTFIIENKEEEDFDYWIDFPSLACCAFAYDMGINISVESEYIPSWVHKGEFDKKELLV